MRSPTSRTLQWLRDNRWEPQVVERWNPWAKMRQDLYGVIDLIAIRDGNVGVLGVQATSDSNRSARIQKIKESALGPLWVRAGNKLWVVTWGKHGGKRAIWTPHITKMEEVAGWWEGRPE